MAQGSTLQFKITLLDIEPTIWRRMQVSDLSTFWDLHVAIQDVMGWKDCHLHQFQVTMPGTKEKEFIGIPEQDDFSPRKTLPGWEHKVKECLESNNKMLYEYDFGDSWTHLIEYEGSYAKLPNQKYPICLGGERTCPPEDVGGVPGYHNFLEIIQNSEDEEHESMLTWVGGSYNPTAFDANNIKFDNPSKRWKRAFGHNLP